MEGVVVRRRPDGKEGGESDIDRVLVVDAVKIREVGNRMGEERQSPCTRNRRVRYEQEEKRESIGHIYIYAGHQGRAS